MPYVGRFRALPYSMILYIGWAFVFKLKQEVSDETVYHDAVDYPVDEDDINDDDCDGEDEENDADNDQESRAAHDNRCVTWRYLSFLCIISLPF